MIAEQVISLLQLCCYLMIIPTCIFLVAAIILSVRWKQGVWVPKEKQKTSSESGAGESKKNSKTVAKSERKGKDVRSVTEETAQMRTVTAKLPDGAEQLLEKLWAQFPDIPANWIMLFRKE